jgi:hypothetical protein
VKADGTFVAGRGATASALTNPAENTYTVTFNKDVSKCSFTANAVGTSSANGFGVQPVAGAPTQVQVDQQNDDADDGNPTTDENRARDFHLQAIC